jgi:hypothetical protein
MTTKQHDNIVIKPTRVTTTKATNQQLKRLSGQQDLLPIAVLLLQFFSH